MFLKKPALLEGREPSVKELTLMRIVSMITILLSNRLASENGNKQDEWPLPSFKTAFRRSISLRM